MAHRKPHAQWTKSPYPGIKGAAVLTGRTVTLFDQVKEVKTRDVEKTGTDIAKEEAEEKEEVWMLQRK